MNRKHLAICAVAVGIGTLGVVGLASAATEGQPASLASQIAQKFNLKEAEVQSVIDQHHDDMKAHHEERMAERLDAAVASGKITAEQKDKILAKHEEMKQFHESLKDKTPEERRAAMKQKHEEMKKWAEDNDIPVGMLKGGVMMHHFKGGPEGGPGGEHPKMLLHEQ